MLVSEQMIKDLNEHLEKDFNVSYSTINIKIDKQFSRLLYIAKKNYVGLIDGKSSAKGLDFLKTSTLPYAAKVQKELIDNILVKNDLDFKSFFNRVKSHFYSTDWNESNLDQITLKQRCVKHPDRYANQNAISLVGKWMIENQKAFYPGIFVPMIVTGNVDGKIEGCHPESGLWKGKIDREYIWNHQVLPKLSRISEVLSPQFDWQAYDSSIVSQRIKKISQYEKWLMDTKKNEHVIEKIKNDVVLSQNQKDDLIKFGMKSRAKSLW